MPSSTSRTSARAAGPFLNRRPGPSLTPLTSLPSLDTASTATACPLWCARQHGLSGSAFQHRTCSTTRCVLPVPISTAAGAHELNVVSLTHSCSSALSQSTTRKKGYVMSFAFVFDRAEDTYEFAYCFPYTYSRLQAYLNALSDRRFVPNMGQRQQDRGACLTTPRMLRLSSPPSPFQPQVFPPRAAWRDGATPAPRSPHHQPSPQPPPLPVGREHGSNFKIGIRIGNPHPPPSPLPLAPSSTIASPRPRRVKSSLSLPVSIRARRQPRLPARGSSTFCSATIPRPLPCARKSFSR